MPLQSILLHAPLISDTDLKKGIGPSTFARASLATCIKDGILVTAAVDEARFVATGMFFEGPRTNLLLHSRDFNNAVYDRTNILSVPDAVGLDGVANAASTLTAQAANGTVFQTISSFADDISYSVDIRRITGTGPIQLTLDGGSTYTDIASQLNTSTYTRVVITENLGDPVAGIRIVDDGDKIEVDYAGVERGAFETSRIETLGSTETRAADLLDYEIANWPAQNTTFSVGLNVTNTVDSVSGALVFLFGGTIPFPLQINSNQFSSLYGFQTRTDGSVFADDNPDSRLVVTWDTDGDHRLYRDKVLRSSGASADEPGIAFTKIRIGSNNTGTNNFFGILSELRIYKDALSQADINNELLGRRYGRYLRYGKYFNS